MDAETVKVVITGIVVFCLYFLPALIAHNREHHQENAIAALNLLLGWTFLGWAAALIWSFTAVKREPADESERPATEPGTGMPLDRHGRPVI